MDRRHPGSLEVLEKLAPVEPDSFFDFVIESDKKLLLMQVNNLAELIFQPLPGRDEKSNIILGYCNHRSISISLPCLRFVVLQLYKQYAVKGIRPGDTVLVSCLGGDNELFTAIHFLALTSYGVRVFLPMFMEFEVLTEWLDLVRCRAVMISGKEILSLRQHEKEKANLSLLQKSIEDHHLPLYDLVEDFNLIELLNRDFNETECDNNDIIREAENGTTTSTEAMIITTSGSSGKSKLILYEQGAFIRSCLSYQAAGLFDREKLGGRAFTPLFSHMMGIRTFFNALWTGVPVCLITATLFLEDPEIARYLLIQLKPEYIIGGPSVYNLLLELMRHYPEIKETIHSSFKTLVSSGAPVNNSTTHSFQKIFGIRMHNALGTTETQQVANTILYDHPDELDLTSLGAPLPGVTLGLKKYSEEDNLYSLYVKSPFGMKSIVNEVDSTDREWPPSFYKTGDIVTVGKGDRLFYVGRENVDFFKDGFGVKIPISSVKTYYRQLFEKTEHVEFYSVNSNPGLAALLFIDNPSMPRGAVFDKEVIDEYADFISEINNGLYRILMPFEFQHRAIHRIAILNTAAPRTVKGNVSRYKIQSEFGALVEQLCDPFSSDMAIKDIRADRYDSFTRYLNPWVGQMLLNLGIDYHYHRAKKDTLFTYVNGREIPVLDMLGGYGSNLIGHNNDEMKSAVMSFLKQDEVELSDQGSKQKYAGLLAEELNRLVGGVTGKDFSVILGSTGAEAVEIALHHALFEWKKRIEKIEHDQFQRYGAVAGRLLDEVWQNNRTILSSSPVYVITLKKAFHGHSSGARALLGNKGKGTCFSNILGIHAIPIDDESTDWEKELKDKISGASVKLTLVRPENGKLTTEEVNVCSIIAAIAEPVIGEGGIHVVNRNLLRELTHREYPLIMDEIQCGLGRTGSFLASEGIGADYYLFAKALGGGVEKICAVLIVKSRSKNEFGEYYSSTFANGGLACKAALTALSIIERENIPQRAREKGQCLNERLNAIRTKYPDVIEKITGKGLMQGIVLRDCTESDSIFLRNLYKEKLLGYVSAAYLLRRHDVRTLPSLSAPNVLRVEPSAFITEEEIDKFIRAIEDLGRVISELRTYELLRPIMDDDNFDDNKGKIPRWGWLYTKIDPPKPGCVKVAFIAHLTHPMDELRLIEKDLSKASDTGLRILQKKMLALLDMKPLLLFSQNLFQGRVHFSFYLFPFDTAELERLNRKGKRRLIVSKIQKTIDLAAENGATIISLGAYTSIISNNGLSLVEPKNCKIITGNTLTAASGIHRIVDELKGRGGTGWKLGIVGAAGNIGSAIAGALIDSGIQFEKVYLLGKGKEKLSNVLHHLSANDGDHDRIVVSTDLTLLRHCNVIISSANTNDPIILPNHISATEPVVISDLSVPPSLSADVPQMSNVTVLNFSSYVRLPEDPDFILASTTPRGTSYCCAAEPVLLALEPLDLPFKGKLDAESIRAITRLAEKFHLFDGIEEGINFKSVLK